MTECLNCFIKYSPMWRNGYCNACSTYFKRHHVHKDVSIIYAKILMTLKNG